MKEKNNIEKEYIHIINGETSCGIDLIKDLWGLSATRKFLRSNFAKLKDDLDKYEIRYESFRKVLIPYACAFSYFFDTAYLDKCFYLSKLLISIIEMMDEKSKAVFLGGDIICHNNIEALKILLDKEKINTDMLYESTYCNIIIVGISKSASLRIDMMLRKNLNGYKGFCDLTKPTALKQYLFSYACQFSIKLGNKLIYSSPEPDDKNLDYSGFNVIENESLKKYKLVPILEDVYNTFFSVRPQVPKCRLKELLYSLNILFDIDNIKYPMIVIDDKKIDYIKKSKLLDFEKEQIKKNIDQMIRLNQISHITYTNKDEEKSIDFNVPFYLQDKVYAIACKWNFDTNIVKMITMVSCK